MSVINGRGRHNVISLNAYRCPGLSLVVGVVMHGGHLHDDCPSYVSLECGKTSLTSPHGGAIAINNHAERRGDQTRVTLERNASAPLLLF